MNIVELKSAKRVKLKYPHQLGENDKYVDNRHANYLGGVMFYNVYQITKICTLNILQFCLLKRKVKILKAK